MKYSQLIGIIACIGTIIICFLPWSYVASIHLPVSGMQATGTNFGKPGLLHIIFTSIAILFFSIPKIWAKRWNLLITVLNMAWAIRNFILISTCMYGDCPEIKPSLYLLQAFSAIILVMSFLPKMKVKS
ncbi:MAG: hypothetical protein JSS67_04235 [Bacteroidetes bacterium]|nr:hypothetical protein [Bacteroidota bacterium]